MNKIFVIPHLGLGDLLTCNGIYRSLRITYDEVKIAVLKRNIENASLLFHDDKNITFHPINEDIDISLLFGCPKEKYDAATAGYKVINLGLHKHGLSIQNNKREIIENKKFFDMPFSFYKDAGIPFDHFWEFSYIPTFRKTEDLYHLLHRYGIHDYIFVHNTASTGEVFSLDYIKKKYNVDPHKTFIVNPCKSMYKQGDKFYELSNMFLKHRLPYYKMLIIHAQKVLVTDSSFMCMSINLPINTKECFIISRPYGHGQITSTIKNGAAHVALKNAHIWSDKYIFGDYMKRQKFKEIKL